MKTDLFVQKSSNLFAENRVLKFAVVAMGIAISFNSLMVYRAVKYQRTILIPPSMTGTVEFVQGKPTETYVKDISRRIVNLASTYSPPTARGQFEELLALYTAEAYPQAMKSWYSLAGRIEDSQVSSAFYMEKIKMGDTDIEIFGNLIQFTGDVLLEKKSITYLIDYQIRDGRFEIKEFNEKDLSPAKKERPEEINRK